MRRLLAALGLTALLTGGGLAVSTPAQAAACTGTSGVTVVVQSGSSPQVRCASGDPGSAAAALTAAGFQDRRVAPPNVGAICQIDGVPNTSCARMPPTSQYWAIFHAPAGGSWSYSSAGADSLDPAPGTVVGFRLGSGTAPSIAPPKVEPAPAPSSSTPPPPARTSTSAPRPTSASTSAPRSAPRSSASAGAPAASSTARRSSAGTNGSSASATSGSTASSSSAKTTTSTKGASRSSSSTSASSTSGPPDGETPGAIPPSERSSSAGASAAGQESGTDSGSGSGALLPTLVGGALLLALGGGALVMARRRG